MRPESSAIFQVQARSETIKKEVAAKTPRRVAQLLPNGSLDASSSFGTGADGRVTSIQLAGDRSLLISGSFTAFDGFARNGVARLLGSEVATHPAPAIEGWALVENGFQVQVAGPTAIRYVLLTSEDLESWQEVDELIPEKTPFQMTHHFQEMNAHRFYQIVVKLRIRGQSRLL